MDYAISFMMIYAANVSGLVLISKKNKLLNATIFSYIMVLFALWLMP